MLTTDDFRNSVERYLKLTGIAASRFGKEALGDPNFVFDLRAGRSPRLDVINKVMVIVGEPNHSAPRASKRRKAA